MRFTVKSGEVVLQFMSDTTYLTCVVAVLR
jgi:hypothetical protein